MSNLTDDDVKNLLRSLTGAQKGDSELEALMRDEEIAALLEGKDPGEEAENVIPTKRYSGLEILCDAFARELEKQLGAIGRMHDSTKGVDVMPVSIDIGVFGIVMRSVPVPVSIGIVEMEDFHGHFLSIFDKELATALISSSCGGATRGPVISGRDFSLVEKDLLGVIHALGANVFETAWRRFLPRRKASLSRVEYAPQFAQVAEPGARAFTVVYEITTPAGSGSLTQVIPMDAIPELARLETGAFEPFRGEQDIGPENRVTSSGQAWLAPARETRWHFSPMGDMGEELAVIPVTVLANILAASHPQVATFALSLLGDAKAAAVLLRFPAVLQAEIVSRIDQIRIIPCRMAKTVSEAIVRESLSGMIYPGSRKEALLALVAGIDPEAALRIRDWM